MTYKVPKSILNVKTMDTAIHKAKEALIARAKKKGLYEDFGQAEVSAIRDKFIDPSDFSNDMLKQRTRLQAFSDWASSLSLEDLEEKTPERVSMFD